MSDVIFPQTHPLGISHHWYVPRAITPDERPNYTQLHPKMGYKIFHRPGVQTIKTPMKEGLWGETFARRSVAGKSKRKEGAQAVEVFYHNRHESKHRVKVGSLNLSEAGGDF